MSFGLGKPGHRTPRRPSELLEERGRALISGAGVRLNPPQAHPTQVLNPQAPALYGSPGSLSELGAGALL